MKPITRLATVIMLVAACDVKNPTGPEVGTVAGTINSSKGGPLASVRLTLANHDSTFVDSARSGVDGKWSIGGVPVGTGSVAVDSTSLPAGCASVPPFAYVVQQIGSTTRITLTVAC
jgi:hypothetical protein